MKKLLLSTVFLAFATSAFAACGTGTGTCFWIGGGSTTNWSATAPTNWSATTGGAANATAPVAGDSITFDANSGTGASVINASLSINNFDASASSAVSITHSAAVTLTVTGTTFKLGSNITWTETSGTAVTSFQAPSGTTAITSAGKAVGVWNFGVTGTTATYQLQDNLNATNPASTLTLNFGTFDANGHNVTTPLFNSSNANTRTLTMGTGTWTIGSAAGGTPFTVATTTGLTVSAASSTITMVAPSPFGASALSLGSGFTWGTINLPATAGGFVVATSGGITITTLGITAPNYLKLPGSALTITNGLTLTGSSGSPILIEGTTQGTAANISSANSVTGMWVGLRDTTLIGGGSIALTSSLDFGNTAVTGGGTKSITAPSGGGGGGHIIGG